LVEERRYDDRVAIGALHARYIRLVDENRASELGELFTQDGVLDSQVMGRRCNGREDIVDYIGGLRSWAKVTIHASPADVEFTDRSQARSRSYFTVLTKSGLDHWGAYSDELVQQEGIWLFRSRVIELLGTASERWLGSPGAGANKSA
jgi:hypothetical protein